MYDGYVTFNGDEVINAPRAYAYAEAGRFPPGVKVDRSLADCPIWLSFGQDAYETPLYDDVPAAPWVTDDDASLEFAGVLPLDFTGLSDAGITTSTVDRVTGVGAVFDRPVQGPKTFGVTVLAVATTEAGMEAGLAWLRRTLHPGVGCSDPGCDGFTLQVLAGCPAVLPDDDETEADARTASEDCLPVLRRTFRDVRTVDGPKVVEQIGDDETGDTIMAKVEWTWVAADPYRYRDATLLVIAAESDGDGPTATADGVTVSTPTTQTRPSLITNTGFETNTTGWASYIEGEGTVTLARSTTQAHSGSASGRIITGTPTFVIGWQMSGGNQAWPILSDKNHTFTAYVRAGQAEGSGSAIPAVRFVWYDTDGDLLSTDQQSPFNLEDTRVVIDGRPIGSIPRTSVPSVTNTAWFALRYTSAPPAKAKYVRVIVTIDGVRDTGDIFYLDDADLVGPDLCVLPPASTTTWASSGDTGVDPPAVPTVNNVSKGVPKGYTRRTATIPADVLGDGPVDLHFQFTSEDATPKQAVRVRVWATDDTPDECDFAAEFTIDYLPVNALLTVTESGAYVSRTGEDTVPGEVTGAYGGAFRLPPIGCGDGYTVAVDVPDVHPAAVTGAAAGTAEGVLSWSLVAYPREV